MRPVEPSLDRAGQRETRDSDLGARCWGTQNVAGGGWLVDTDFRREVGDTRVIEEIKGQAASETEGPGV